jgi:hypothetical protein
MNLSFSNLRARGSVVGWGTVLQAARSWVRFLWSRWILFQLTQSFQPHYGPGIHSTTNGNEYQESTGG